MKTLNLKPGNKVRLQTKSKSWEGFVLESYNPEIILLKLQSGYNIGIRESEILDAQVISKGETSKAKGSKSEASNPKLPNIVMIVTGGTISSRLDPKSGAVISTDKEAILDICLKYSAKFLPVFFSSLEKSTRSIL